MSKLYYWYGAMGSGKSLELIKVYYNYINRWMKVLVYNYNLDTRLGDGNVSSRNGHSIPSDQFSEKTDFKKDIALKIVENNISCILIDESQFLKSNQVDDLAHICKRFKVPIITYGLKTNFKWQLFEWSKRLLELAESISEIKTICWCGKKANMNARVINWEITTIGDEIQIWWDEMYMSLCLEHYLEKNIWK